MFLSLQLPQTLLHRLRLVSEAVQVHEHVLGLQFLVLESLRDVVLQLSQHLQVEPVLIRQTGEVLC